MKERVGLAQGAQGFSLFEVFGQLERNMLANEKVADAMFKWEKYARSTNSPKILKLTFKVLLELHVYIHLPCACSETLVCEAICEPK